MEWINVKDEPIPKCVLIWVCGNLPDIHDENLNRMTIGRAYHKAERHSSNDPRSDAPPLIFKEGSCSSLCTEAYRIFDIRLIAHWAHFEFPEPPKDSPATITEYDQHEIDADRINSLGG